VSIKLQKEVKEITDGFLRAKGRDTVSRMQEKSQTTKIALKAK